VVEGTALEKRQARKGLESSNLSLSAMLKLISLNIERSRHLDRIIPFLERERPDILTLQEAVPSDTERFSRLLGLPHLISLRDCLVPNNSAEAGRENIVVDSGIALLSRLPFRESGSEYYYVPPMGIRLEAKNMVDARTTNAQGIVWALVEEEGVPYTFVTTHFTWTRDGQPDAAQRADFRCLSAILTKLPAHILTGDLNAPRGMGMWPIISPPNLIRRSIPIFIKRGICGLSLMRSSVIDPTVAQMSVSRPD
jgi:endonuclease/exonuclease/phosphatase family metal-dependent hydrolase